MNSGILGRRGRSYVLRQGRITKAQQRAWQQHAGRYIVGADFINAAARQRPDARAWAEVFNAPAPAPLTVEIGSGYGEATAAMAAADAGRFIVAFEVHKPGIGALMNRLAAGGIDNVRIVHADALEMIPQLFAGGSVAAFNIFFPDPWPKKKHRKRRLICPQTLSLLLDKLADGGGAHFVTDWQPYAEHAAAAFAEQPRFAAAPPPPRSATGYELRAAAARRPVHALYFVKQSESPREKSGK